MHILTPCSSRNFNPDMKDGFQGLHFLTRLLVTLACTPTMGDPIAQEKLLPSLPPPLSGACTSPNLNSRDPIAQPWRPDISLQDRDIGYCFSHLCSVSSICTHLILDPWTAYRSSFHFLFKFSVRGCGPSIRVPPKIKRKP